MWNTALHYFQFNWHWCTRQIIDQSVFEIQPLFSIRSLKVPFFKWGLLSLVLQFISSGVQQAHNNTEKRSYQSLFSHLGLYLVKWGHFHGLTLVFILLFWVWWLDWACPQGSGKHQWRSGQSFLLRKGWKSHWNSIIRSLKSHLWSER